MRMKSKNSKRPISFFQSNFFPKSQKGQFYLLGAIIIIGVIIGFVAISNYSKTKSYNLGEKLKEELKIESMKVLDYGTYNDLDEDAKRILLENFITSYIAYEGKESDLYFIFGNREKVVIMGYQELATGIYVDIGEGESILEIGKEGNFSGEFDINPGNYKIVLKTNGNEYLFTLKPGENFYFVISQRIDGEQYIVTG
jgi:hypothetical protein